MDVYLLSTANNWTAVVPGVDTMAGWTLRSSIPADLTYEDAWQTIEAVYTAGNDITGNITICGTGDTLNDFCYFDNIEVTQVGCVVQLEEDGIGDQWLDKSGNEHHGAITVGAIPTSLPTPKPVFISAAEFGFTDGNSGQINATGVHGHSMTDGELSVTGYIPFKHFGFDVSKPIYVQVVWCNIAGVTTDGVTWTVTYDQDALESGVVTAPATALDTALVEDLEHEDPYVIQRTERGIIDAGNLNNIDPIAWQVCATTVDQGADPGTWFMGLQLSQ